MPSSPLGEVPQLGQEQECEAQSLFVPKAHGLATHEFDLVCRLLVRIALRLAEKTDEASHDTDTPETKESKK